jgi:hypothetical protein
MPGEEEAKEEERTLIKVPKNVHTPRRGFSLRLWRLCLSSPRVFAIPSSPLMD